MIKKTQNGKKRKIILKPENPNLITESKLYY